MDQAISRRALLGAAAFTIVPRHVLGRPFIPPSDRITLATIGLGRQGQAVTMSLLPRPEVQVVAVCDCNRGSKDYMEYGDNALLTAARRLLGPGYEKWAEDLASPGRAQLTREFSSSLGMGGREPAKRFIEAYYGVAQRRRLQRMHRVPRLPRAAGQGKGPRRRLRRHPRPLARAHLHRRDAQEQGRALPEADGALHRRRPPYGAGRPRNEGRDRAAGQQSVERKHAPDRVLDLRRRHRPACARSTTGPPVRIGRKASSAPRKSQPVPDGLDWDMWVGPAPERPFNKAYLPFVWRGWYDFGCGSFGDMGCYSFAGVFKILDLTPPVVGRGLVQRIVRRDLSRSRRSSTWITPRATAAPPITWRGTTAPQAGAPRRPLRRPTSAASDTTTKASCTSATRA